MIDTSSHKRLSHHKSILSPRSKRLSALRCAGLSETACAIRTSYGFDASLL